MMELELKVDLFHLNIVDFFVLIVILTEGKKCQVNGSSVIHIPE